ncbi:hypothetical protein [Brevundimonas sp. DS20]|uniref:hypothetical protein n=1 Tax=Brevundimonas sp. DS20 TaxID=1532555 RepID=UPI0012E281F4|nr:hypothetical protein [Brevundimonas sp. DS20]MEC7796677.1 hypothetical protein [Pseudomonadota bacterium]
MLRLTGALALATVMMGGPVLACSLALGDQVEVRARDLRAVTGVYEARIENTAWLDQYGNNVDFTVRPTLAVWGPVSPRSLRLSYRAGACTNWLFLMDDEGEPRNGSRVLVFASPEAETDKTWLYIVKADAEYIESFMSDWRAAIAGQPLPGPK